MVLGAFYCQSILVVVSSPHQICILDLELRAEAITPWCEPLRILRFSPAPPCPQVWANLQLLWGDEMRRQHLPRCPDFRGGESLSGAQQHLHWPGLQASGALILKATPEIATTHTCTHSNIIIILRQWMRYSTLTSQLVVPAPQWHKEHLCVCVCVCPC